MSPTFDRDRDLGLGMEGGDAPAPPVVQALPERQAVPVAFDPALENPLAEGSRALGPAAEVRLQQALEDRAVLRDTLRRTIAFLDPAFAGTSGFSERSQAARERAIDVLAQIPEHPIPIPPPPVVRYQVTPSGGWGAIQGPGTERPDRACVHLAGSAENLVKHVPYRVAAALAAVLNSENPNPGARVLADHILGRS